MVPPPEYFGLGALGSLAVILVGWATAGLWRESGKLRQDLRAEIASRNEEIRILKEEVATCNKAHNETAGKLWRLEALDESKTRQLEYLQNEISSLRESRGALEAEVQRLRER